MAVPSIPAVIGMVDVAPRSYFLTPASEPKLTKPEEVHESIRGLKMFKVPGPNGIPNRASKRLPRHKVFLLVQIFNEVSHPLLSNSVEARPRDLHP